MHPRKASDQIVRRLVIGSVLTATAFLTSGFTESRPPLLPQPLPPLQLFLAEARARLVSDQLLQVHYTFEERHTHYERDAAGNLTQTLEELIEAYPALEADLDYRRVVSVNGKSVPARDLEKHDREHAKRVQDWVARVQREGANPASRRLEREQIEHAKERALIDELFLLYEVRSLDREMIAGRPAIAFSLAPRQGYEPRHPDVRLAKNFGGRAWLDEAEHQLVRIEMEALQDVSLAAGFVARLSKGSRVVLERRRFEDGTWLPLRAHYVASGRLLLVKRIELDQLSEYSNYKPQPIDRIPVVGGAPPIR